MFHYLYFSSAPRKVVILARNELQQNIHNGLRKQTFLRKSEVIPSYLNSFHQFREIVHKKLNESQKFNKWFIWHLNLICSIKILVGQKFISMDISFGNTFEFFLVMYNYTANGYFSSKSPCIFVPSIFYPSNYRVMTTAQTLRKIAVLWFYNKEKLKLTSRDFCPKWRAQDLSDFR